MSSMNQVGLPTLHQTLSALDKILDKLAAELLDKETLDQHEIAAIFKGVKKLPERKEWLSSAKRPSQKLPPVAVPAKASVEQRSIKVGQSSEKKAPAKRAAKPKKTTTK